MVRLVGQKLETFESKQVVGLAAEILVTLFVSPERFLSVHVK